MIDDPAGGARAAIPEQLAGRVRVVQELTERLSAAGDMAALVAAIADGAREVLGAEAVLYAHVSEDGAALVSEYARGVSPETVELLAAPLSWDADSPASVALHKGSPVLWSSATERDRRYPGYAQYPTAMQAWAVVPLVVQGSAIGILSMGWPDRHRFDEVEAGLLQVIGHQCAVAIDRMRIDEARRAEREMLEFLAEGTRLMVSAIEPKEVVRKLVDLAVPRLAPWCAVYVARGDSLQRVALALAGDEELAAALLAVPDLPFDAPTPVAAAFRTGALQVVDRLGPAAVRVAYPPPYATRILEYAESWSGFVVPVVASGQLLGVISLMSGDWGDRPPERVRFGAEGLAARAGVALMNAQRFDRERQTVATLVEALLPGELPTVPGYQFAARYLPIGGRVAGDWFDVAVVDEAGVIVGLGDAGGHGIPAASLMAQLRNAARGLAFMGSSPAQILEGLARVTTADGADRFATAAYARLDVNRHTMRWSAAGQLPPLLVRARPVDVPDKSTGRDRRASTEVGDSRLGSLDACYLEGDRNPPLSWPAPLAAEHVVELQAGSAVVFVTDGIVERRGTSLDDGMERLRQLVTSIGVVPASTLLDGIVGEMCGDAEDDCCILVVKRA